MTLIGLASSLCPNVDPEALLDTWRKAQHGETSLGLVTDPRLDLPLQRALLEQAHGIDVIQLCLPRLDTRGRAQPCPCSADRTERRAAQKLLLAQIELAGTFEVPAVILPWVELELHRSMTELQRLFARAEPLPLDDLDAERASLGEAISDRLLEWLDAALLHASNHDVKLLLCTPAIWPHQAPHALELDRLGGELAGAPLGLLRGLDWAHARQSLRGEQEAVARGPAPLPVEVAALCVASGVPLDPAELGLAPLEPAKGPLPGEVAALPLCSLRLADASGLGLRLPPGLGEIDGPSLRHAMAEHPAVLWLAPLWRGELRRTLESLQGEPEQ